MDKVGVQGLRFFAYHGVHPQEQKLGCWFKVDVTLLVDRLEVKNDDLGETIDYVSVSQIAENSMSIPRKLIETVAEEIAQNCLSKFSSIAEVVVRVEKLVPALGMINEGSFVEVNRRA